MGAPYDIDDTLRLGAPYDIGDIVSTDYFFTYILCGFFSNISFNFLGRTFVYVANPQEKKIATHTKVYKMSQYVSSLV